MGCRCHAFLLCVLLCLGWCAEARAQSASQPEFRGLAFGAPLADMPDMELVARFGDTAFYRRPNEKPLLGEACSTDIRYGFSRGALFFVRMTLAGCEGLGDLVAAYDAKYGRPAREGAPGFLRLVWRRPLFSVSLSHFARDGKTVVDYLYLPGMSADEREVWQSAEDIRRRGPIGFRGLRFGRKLSGIPGLTPAYREGAAAYYRRPGDSLELGDLRLTDILYGFFQDRLFAVVMRVGEGGDFEALRRAYIAKYGPPRAIAATLEEELVWSWPEAQIALSRDVEAGGVTIRYADAKLLAAMDAAETAAGAPPALSGGFRLFSQGDPPRSFRGAAFGSPPQALPAGEYLYTHRGRKYYRRGDERLHLGDIPLASVLYGYDQNRLAGVALTIAASSDGPDSDYKRVLAAYSAKYGQPETRPSDDGGRIHQWSWPGLSIALVRPKVGPMEVHYVDASLLRHREGRIAAKALDALDKKIFAAPDAAGEDIERKKGQE
ncbi:conserved hypothetical protein [Solidesulfovibrio fructosivorans JJ]]|uniref:Uncharacterized protein n=1 Tax=Solidesulfovibrio fructosivorans JJ] TaxID=596151 RepID=E1JZ88_SOLFR|nr:hypothetical protein [Solidesulfovibrio fructosivorans]EFL50371.1 conserved hypothetical protein [Solidesulfovibrio fructosivorans JJ]]